MRDTDRQTDGRTDRPHKRVEITRDYKGLQDRQTARETDREPDRQTDRQAAGMSRENKGY